jgi:hypothetical protein
LAQLANFQFGRNSAMATAPAPLAQPQTPAPALLSFDPGHQLTPSPRITLSPVAVSNGNGNGNGHAHGNGNGQHAPVAKTTEQKLEEFYGVKQIGEDVVFRAHFTEAKKVLIAGDFNNWTPVSTPMQQASRPGEWRMHLPLSPGRYRYRLVVDGKWITDPNNQYVEANQFGELNNIVEVA